MKKKNIIILSVLFITILLVLSTLFINNYINKNNDKENLDDKTNNNVSDTPEVNLVGQWIADGTQNWVLLEIKRDGTYVYADDYTNPYDMFIYEDGTYYINYHNKMGEEYGKYKITNGSIWFTPDDTTHGIYWRCNIDSEDEITNCPCAESFSRVE